MLKLNQFFQKKTPAVANDELIWKTSISLRKAKIIYGGEDFGYLKLKGVFRSRAEGEFMGRDFSIRPASIWSTRYIVTDETRGEEIALIKVNFIGRIKMVLHGNETFLWRQNIWGLGSWWWQKIDEFGVPERASVKTKVSSYLLGEKGRIHLNEVEEENLNAMIMGGLFVNLLRNQGEL